MTRAVLPALRQWARALKRDVVAVWYAARDPATPFPVRMLALAVAAYALSPIDLIPDFIPVLGYVDDVLLVPLGLWLVLRLLPPAVLQAARECARQRLERPQSRVAAFFIVLAWVMVAGAFMLWWSHRAGLRG